MQSSINTTLFDRFMLVNRQMRTCKPTPASGRDTQLANREIILVILYRHGASMRQQDVMREIHVSKSTLSEMINRLVEDGYLERASDPKDRRSTIIVLTERGRTRAEEVMDEHGRIVDGLFCRLSDAEKTELVRLLDRLLGEASEGRV